MSMPGSSTDAPQGKKSASAKRAKTFDLASDASYQSLVNAVEKSVKETGSEGSGPMDTLNKLRDERQRAKKTSLEKTKELHAYTKKVKRLQHRAAKLSDDCLLVEYARRQAAKAQKKVSSSAA